MDPWVGDPGARCDDRARPEAHGSRAEAANSPRTGRLVPPPPGADGRRRGREVRAADDAKRAPPETAPAGPSPPGRVVRCAHARFEEEEEGRKGGAPQGAPGGTRGDGRGPGGSRSEAPGVPAADGEADEPVRGPAAGPAGLAARPVAGGGGLARLPAPLRRWLALRRGDERSSSPARQPRGRQGLSLHAGAPSGAPGLPGARAGPRRRAPAGGGAEAALPRGEARARGLGRQAAAAAGCWRR